MKNDVVKAELNVINNKINVIRVRNNDYISLTDLARLQMRMIQDFQYKTG